MNLWTVIGLSISAVLVGLGIALGQGPTPVFGTLLLVLGGSLAAVVLAIWSAFAMGFRRTAQSRARATSVRLDALIHELASHARLASDKGILLIADARISTRQGLFVEGARRLVSAEPAASLRDALSTLADREAEREFQRRRHIITFCRFVPVTALALGFASALWMLMVAVRPPIESSSGTALALLCAVYGAFAISALAVDAADRLTARTAEDELAASLIIETIVALRNAETPDMISARLRGMIPPAPSIDRAADSADTLRRAA